MLFDEKEDITLDATRDWMIYFLLKNNEVVYVGQTTQNVIRPFSHKDKDFDTVKIIYQPEDKDLLNRTEEFYIKKYSPRYNKVFNADNYSNSLVRRIFELEKIKKLSQYYMTREEINDELEKYKAERLSKREFKRLYKFGYHKYENLYLMDPDSLLKLISQRINPSKSKKSKNFSSSIEELLKSYELEEV